MRIHVLFKAQFKKHGGHLSCIETIQITEFAFNVSITGRHRWHSDKAHIVAYRLNIIGFVPKESSRKSKKTGDAGNGWIKESETDNLRE